MKLERWNGATQSRQLAAECRGEATIRYEAKDIFEETSCLRELVEPGTQTTDEFFKYGQS